jgi:hypothetical protein
VNSWAVSRTQPRNEISCFRTDDVSVASPCAHQAAKTIRRKDSIRAEVKEIVRDEYVFSA